MTIKELYSEIQKREKELTELKELTTRKHFVVLRKKANRMVKYETKQKRYNELCKIEEKIDKEINELFNRFDGS